MGKHAVLMAVLMLGVASFAQENTPLPKPTNEAIAAAKDVFQTIVSGNERDYNRAEAKLKIEAFTDLHANAVLWAHMTSLHTRWMGVSLPVACVGDVNKQLRTGEWPGMPDSCTDKK